MSAVRRVYRARTIKRDRRTRVARQLAAHPKQRIAADVADALHRRVRPDRIPVGDLTGVVLRVDVRTVTRDRDQRELAEVCTYSVVDRIVGPA